MKSVNKLKLVSLALAIVAMAGSTVKAGNPDRIGQAGATELLINP